MTESANEKKFGSFLKEARLTKNISIEEVSKHTKIHPNILKAIEAEDVRSLGTVYARSFIKIYAEYLGLDKEDIVRRFDGLKASAGSSYARDSRETAAPLAFKEESFLFDTTERLTRILKKIPWVRIFVIVLVLFIFLGVFKFVQNKRKRPAVSEKIELFKTSGKKPLPAQKQKKKMDVKVSQTKKVPSPAIASEITKPTVVKFQEESKAPSTLKVPVSRQEAEKIVLVLRAKEKTWLQVKVDGKIVFQGILAKGVAENWQAKEKIELWLGNAGVVQLEMNGRLLEKIGRPGQTLKHVVVTKAGLSIEK